MRKITEIIVHCTATKEGKNYTVNQIRRWHLQRGFSDIGYHFVIYLNGTIVKGRPIEQVGAHCKMHNWSSIGVCYVGGLDSTGLIAKDTRTEAQKRSLTALLSLLHTKYPQASLHGHREFANKSCPCFDVHKDYDYIFKS